MTDKEAIECADKLGTYCRGKDCEECPFYDRYNDCTLELERPGMWDLEYLLKEAQDDGCSKKMSEVR
jgi:hypothetical protein